MDNFQDGYGIIDKALHYFAFKTTRLQIALAKQESLDIEEKLKLIKLKKPVFISSLPRSGTTILLESLTQTELFSYHSYQDMPFILTPLIWSKFTRMLTLDETFRERAHNDGIKINPYSPEAFEEMLFMAFWPQAYTDTAIPYWQTSQHKKFDTFFSEHIKKLIWRDRHKKNGTKRRYLSKNNLNIIRLPYIKQLFPDSLLLIPFREPIQHALSLLKQHQNFTNMHQDNKFSMHYMRAIGHFDFGANLKPMNFNHWYEHTVFKPDTLNFWLEYWLQTYQYLLETDNTEKKFISFDNLCKNPRYSFNVLFEHLQIDHNRLEKSIAMIKEAKPHQTDKHILDQQNTKAAQTIYQRLLDVAIIN
ncbi:MAG: sulfotransferase [Pseudomonadota bacterium]